MKCSPEFDPSRTAEAAFQAVNNRFPGKVTMQDAARVTESIANNAKILDFVSPLVINRLHKMASREDR